MAEYYIVANSFAAPFFSDTSTCFTEAETPKAALEKFAFVYKHPSGLFAAFCYADANAEAKGEKPLEKWLCNHEIEKERITKNLSGYSYRGDGPGKFEVNGKPYTVSDPKGGRVIAA